VRVEEIEPAPLKAGELRVRIEAALTCGTDLKVYKRGYHERMIAPPAVFGHEFSGVIEERGSAGPESAREWRLGDRVVAANSAPCGRCFYCRQGRENLCDDLLFLNGAYAESIIVPARLVEKNLLRLRPETAFADAALVEPLACVAQGMEDLELQSGEHLLVLGAGPIGLMFAILGRELGCEVTVAGRRAPRLEAARRLGADRVIDLENAGDPIGRIQEAGSASFDAVVEAVGKPELWQAAVQLVRKGGVVNWFGGCPAGTSVSLDTTRVHYSGLTLLASFHHTPRAVRQALEFIEKGVIRARDFVDGECPLSRLPQLFHSMAEGNRTVKTLIQVRE